MADEQIIPKGLASYPKQITVYDTETALPVAIVTDPRYLQFILAAPLMLAALEAEAEWQGRDLAGQIDPEWDYEVMVGAKRRAAIAAATGSAS